MSRYEWDKFELIPFLAVVLLAGHVLHVAVKSEDDLPTTVIEEAIPGTAVDPDVHKTAELPTTEARL